MIADAITAAADKLARDHGWAGIAEADRSWKGNDGLNTGERFRLQAYEILKVAYPQLPAGKAEAILRNRLWEAANPGPGPEARKSYDAMYEAWQVLNERTPYE